MVGLRDASSQWLAPFIAPRGLVLAVALSLAACSDGATTGSAGGDVTAPVDSAGAQGDGAAGAADASPDGVGIGGDKDGEGTSGGPIAPGDFGAPCNSNTDCTSGFCVEGPNGFVCTETCLADCPDGFSCKAIQNTLPDVVFLCMPDGAKPCTPCQEDFQCPGGACRDLGDGSFCLAPCGEGQVCPTGYACGAADGGGWALCMPANGTCSCTAGNDGLQRACSTQTPKGACWGVETCDVAAGWGGCTALTPADEVCNGLDDDCNGLIDDALPPTKVCENAVPGVGTCPGTATCAGPLGWVCGAKAPTAEACDGLDNDCDGQTDEDFRTGEAYTAFEHCGACNVSCGNGFPHAVAACDATAEPPRCHVVDCEAGWSKLDDTQCIPGAAGLCEPCANDEQCLLQGSRCIPLGGGSFCGTPCADGVTCPDGFTCSPVEGGADQCVPDNGTCACSDATPGLSKSCSVTVQEPGAPVTTCFGLQKCDPTTGFGPCELPVEACDLLDNDCDGDVDEDFRNPATGAYDQPENCGQCGNNCTFLSFDNGVATCDATKAVPVCAMACLAGHVDVDQNPANGCECSILGATDVPDNAGTDDNCDGIDGEVDNGVFVAKNGSDLAPGTIDEPKLTIQAAIAAASSQGKRDVYVATGVYQGSVKLVGGVGVYGGYRSDFRQREALLYETVIFGTEPTGALPGAVNGIDLTGAPAKLDGFTIFGWTAKAPGASSYAVYLRGCSDAVAITGNRIVGGRGGNGTRGTDGGGGADGVSGKAGAAAKDCGKATCSGVNAGGGGGGKICGGADVSGGKGGDATCPDYDESGSQPKSNPYKQTFTVEHGGGGKGPGAGAGGTAGYDSLLWSGESGCGICRSPKPEDGALFWQGPGKHGTNGADGTNGGAGSGCGAGGSVSGGLWAPASGTGGGGGNAGGGGGGGGAGGGVETSNCSQWDNSDWGGGGGGGGSGGCAGTGAGGGTGGGGSFAVFLTWTAAPASAPTLYGNAIVTGDGGLGGDGGSGGTGGTGGDGLSGGGPGDSTPNAWCSEQGGNGGRGGNGGHGGGGGGGCGGASYGIYGAGQGGVDLGVYASANTFDLAGSPGAGGKGGASLGQAGKDGSAGPAGPVSF